MSKTQTHTTYPGPMVRFAVSLSLTSFMYLKQAVEVLDSNDSVEFIWIVFVVDGSEESITLPEHKLADFAVL